MEQPTTNRSTNSVEFESQNADFLRIPMSILGVTSALTLVAFLFYRFTKNQIGFVVFILLMLATLSLYLYIAVHIIYKYYWYFNGGKITADRELDMSMLTRSSFVTIMMFIFSILGLLSLYSLAQAGTFLFDYLPADYASMAFGFIPALIIAFSIFCIAFIILYFYVQTADKKKTNVLKMEINCNRFIIFSVILHYAFSIQFYITTVIPLLKNSDISITTNNLFILSLAGLELKLIGYLILTNLDNGQTIASQSQKT